MKRAFAILFAAAALEPAAAQQVEFSDFFTARTMRYDCYHAGDSRSEEYFFDELKEEPHWGGSKTALSDTTGYGARFFRIVDLASGREIYSRGYSTLFDEWRSTPEADSVRRVFPESVVFPYPKRPCRIEIYGRSADGRFERRMSQTLDPESCYVSRFAPSYETFEVSYGCSPEHCLDIVLLPEGYSASERGEFETACREFAAAFGRFSPYRENLHRISIRGVWVPSAESGVTMPGEGVWRRTACGASFYTFGAERYQAVPDFQRLRDLAACVPYDCIYVLSNTRKYGGGGIFNFYGISAANHPARAAKIYIHEFGHLLLGLGDEYVDPTAFEGLYSKDVEPWEENLTTLADFGRKFWRRMIPAGVPVPTPDTEEYDGAVGVFEGGGYMAEGVYRPWRNCLMNNLNEADSFCPVCAGAIERYLDFICR